MASSGNIQGVEKAGILFLALCIDFLQPAMLALMPMVFVGSASWIAWIPVVGQIAATVAAFAGVAFSFILDMFLTMLGFIFIGGWLWMRGTPPGWRFFATSAFEMIPMLNYLPAFTLGAYFAMNAANNNGKGSLLMTAASFLPIGRVATLAMGARGASAASGASQAAQAQAAARESQVINEALQAAQTANDAGEPEPARPKRVGTDIREPRYADTPQEERLAA